MISKENDDETCALLYDTLITYFLHVDYLIWTRIELTAVFQASVLAAGLSLRTYWFGPGVMFVGGLFTIFLYLFITRLFDNKNVNLELIDYLANRLVPEEFKQQTIAEIGRLKRIEKANKLTRIQRERLLKLKKYEERFIWFSDPGIPRWRNWARASHLLKITLIMFIIIDFGLAIFYRYYAN